MKTIGISKVLQFTSAVAALWARFDRKLALLRETGEVTPRGSGGSVAEALALDRLVAYNEYRRVDAVKMGITPTQLEGEGLEVYRTNRNAAKARRRKLRAAPTRTPWKPRTNREART